MLLDQKPKKVFPLTFNKKVVFLFALGLFCCQANNILAQCTPTGANLCASGDDNTIIYVGGVSIGYFPYAGAPGTGGAGNPTCMSVPVSLLTTATVCLAVYTQNTAPLINFSSWDLDITCSGGLHSEITSDNGGGGLQLYYTPTGNPSTPPAPDGSGNPWYSPNYSPAVNPFTFTGTPVTCAENWANPIFNPVTGAQLNFQANNCQGDSSAGNVTGALFWRECVPIPTPAPTLPPSNFTITKSIIGGPVYNVPGSNDATVTFLITFCNTGMPVTTSGVTIQDNISGAGMQYLGGCVPTPTQSQPFAPYCPGNGSVVYPINFPGNFCQSVTFAYTNYYFPNDWCATFVNDATISDNVLSVTSNSVTGNLVCPTNTFTYTPSYTFTPTFTYTPTPTWTNTAVPSTRTPTPTFTNTPSYTPTPTWTSTPAPGTFTATNTFTATTTYTPTSTWTFTVTPTPIPGGCQIFPPKGQSGFVWAVQPDALEGAGAGSCGGPSQNTRPLPGMGAPGLAAQSTGNNALTVTRKRTPYARPV